MTKFRVWLYRVLVWLAALLACSPVESVRAGTGQLFTLPMPRVKPRSGVRLELDTRWVSGNGYRPVRVRVSPLAGGVAPADRYFDVTVRPYGWRGGHTSAATVTVGLLQGQSFGEAILNIPQTTEWSSYDITTHEDGRRLDDLSEKRISGTIRFYYDSQDGNPTVLFLHRMAPDLRQPLRNGANTGLGNPLLGIRTMAVPAAGGFTSLPMLGPAVIGPGTAGRVSPYAASDQEIRLLPDVRVLASCFPMTYYAGVVTPDRTNDKRPTTDAETLRLVNDLLFFEIVPLQSMPDQWISYSGVDILLAPLQDLELLAASYPEKWSAVRQWLSTGAVLCVYGLGGDFRELPRLHQLLELPASVSPDGAVDDGWSAPNPKHYTDEISALDVASGSTTWWRGQAIAQRRAVAMQSGESPPPLPAASPPPVARPFLLRAVGDLQIVAIVAEDPFPGTEKDWSWIFNSIPSRRWLWYQRQGLSNHQDNDQYWNFLIPGIGRAPVLSFLALITLFAAVIGPVNYFLLRRAERLSWLLVTVPAGAGLVTVSLLVYATLSDGLGVRVRVRSWTDIDQRRGQAVSWSRQTYYAGLAPSEGLVFPADAAVYSLVHRPTNRLGTEDTSRLVRWDEQQHLARGYFRSRTLCQLLVVEPRDTPAGLRVEEPGDGRPPRVTNELGVAIEQVLLCDSQGTFFAGGPQPDGAVQELRGTNRAEEGLRWRAVLNAHRLNYPDGFDPARLDNVSQIFGNPRFSQSGTPAPLMDTSILEQSLRSALASDFVKMTPRSYVARVARPPLVSLGVASAEEVAGFHIVQGIW